MNSAVTNDKIMYANGWKNMLWGHWCGMITNRRDGKNQYAPQVLRPEYKSLTWNQINVTQCVGETEMVAGRMYTAFELCYSAHSSWG